MLVENSSPSSGRTRRLCLSVDASPGRTPSSSSWPFCCRSSRELQFCPWQSFDHIAHTEPCSDRSVAPCGRNCVELWLPGRRRPWVQALGLDEREGRAQGPDASAEEVRVSRAFGRVSGRSNVMIMSQNRLPY